MLALDTGSPEFNSQHSINQTQWQTPEVKSDFQGYCQIHGDSENILGYVDPVKGRRADSVWKTTWTCQSLRDVPEKDQEGQDDTERLERGLTSHLIVTRPSIREMRGVLQLHHARPYCPVPSSAPHFLPPLGHLNVPQFPPCPRWSHPGLIIRTAVSSLGGMETSEQWSLNPLQGHSI